MKNISFIVQLILVFATISLCGCNFEVVPDEENLPQAVFKVDTTDNGGYAPCKIRFENTSNYAKRYKWILNTDTLNPIITTEELRDHSWDFDIPGYYNMVLIADNLNGKKDTTDHDFYIKQRPEARFHIGDCSFCSQQSLGFVPTTLNFTNTSLPTKNIPQNNKISYLWNFGNGDTSNTLSPTYEYTKAGTYNVSLTVKDDFGAQDSKTISITLHEEILTNE